MVFDWFQRTVAGGASDSQMPPSQEAEAASEAGPGSLLPPADDSPQADGDPSGAASGSPLADPSDQAPAAEGPPPQPAAAQSPSIGAVDEAALDWARQAYARLKAQQQAAAAAPAPGPAVAVDPAADAAPETVLSSQAAAAAPDLQEIGAEQPAAAPAAASSSAESFRELPAETALDGALRQGAATPESPEAQEGDPASLEAPPPSASSPSLSLLERAAAQRQQRLLELTAGVPELSAPAGGSEQAAAVVPGTAEVEAPGQESEAQLGAFDETFTWSAEVLAAQGRRVEDISLEEIDWLSRLRRGLEKTRRGFVSQLLENLGDDPLTPEVLDDLETTLLRADVGVQATDQVLEALRRRLNEEVVDPAEGLRFLKQQLRDLLQAPIEASGVPLLAPQRDRLNIWLLVGVNGVGKTTTLGKLANLAVRSGYGTLIAAADTFRAAAVQQVSVWGERSGVPVIANPTANADPAAVVFDAIGAARSRGSELVLVDTAGRLQTKHNLMEELSKVRRIIDRLAPEAAVESLLVLDASQGQNGLRQAMAFASAASLTGVVITKLDGSARGGVALAVASEAGLPIRFIGAGETIRDLRPFNSFEFVEALLAG